MEIKEYNTGNRGELVASVPRRNKKVVVYSLSIGPLLAGDILIVLGEVEATNDLLRGTRFTTQIRLGTSSADIGGREITEGNAFNITRGMHHGVATKAGTLTVPKDMPTAYVNLTAWSNRGISKIEQDYGRLGVVRMRQ